MTQTRSDFLVDRLHQWGIRRIFGYPGDGINGVVGALDRAKERVKLVQARQMLGRMAISLITAILIAGCGGERNATTRAPAESTASATTGAAANAGQPSEAGAPTVPAWIKVDQSAKTVSADIEAGKTADNNHWNFNGYYNGSATITVPAGYKVRIQLKNDDPAVAHSIGVDSRTGDFPPTFQNPQPVFPGAISQNPTSPQGGTPPGKSATISFTATKPGQYSLVCYMPGHAAAGMWVHFNVSEEGKAGLSTP